MHFWPELTETGNTDWWTPAQIREFLWVSYGLLIIFAIATGITMHNFFTLVIKRGNCKITHPLFAFYILIILTLIGDMIYSLLIVRVYANWAPFIVLMPPTFKCLSGIEQIWMLIELSLHLRIEIKAHSQGAIYSQHEMLERLGKFIERGRIVVLIICLILFVAQIVFCLQEAISVDPAQE